MWQHDVCGGDLARTMEELDVMARLEGVMWQHDVCGGDLARTMEELAVPRLQNVGTKSSSSNEGTSYGGSAYNFSCACSSAMRTEGDVWQWYGVCGDAGCLDGWLWCGIMCGR
jgi:hypothetical protein